MAMSDRKLLSPKRKQPKSEVPVAIVMEIRTMAVEMPFRRPNPP
jgi:hypothetical protein